MRILTNTASSRRFAPPQLTLYRAIGGPRLPISQSDGPGGWLFLPVEFQQGGSHVIHGELFLAPVGVGALFVRQNGH